MHIIIHTARHATANEAVVHGSEWWLRAYTIAMLDHPIWLPCLPQLFLYVAFRFISHSKEYIQIGRSSNKIVKKTRNEQHPLVIGLGY